MTITGNNASNNDILCKYLYELLLKEYDDYLERFPTRGQSIRFRGEASRIRCFAHILNLVVKAILADLGSSTQKQAMEFLDRAAIDIANRSRTRITLPGAQNSIAKLRIIILWIHRSAQRVQEWRARGNVKKLPNYDVDTRWNFTLQMIEDSFDCRAAINDSCIDIEALRDMKLTNSEWETLDKIRSVLRPFKKFTEYVSREQPSIQMLVRMYNEVGLTLHQITRKQGEFSSIDDGLTHAIHKGIEVFDKYWGLLGDEHDLYYIATVFDPRIKIKWIQDNIENSTEVIARIRTFLKATYPPPDIDLPDNHLPDVFQSLEYTFVEPYIRADNDATKHDIDTYLDTPCVRYTGKKTDDQTKWILDWWSANKTQYPCTALAAREILAIPASEVDCERLFGQAKDMLGIRRYSMIGETMRVMMLLKGALQSLQGLITKEEVEEEKDTQNNAPHMSNISI